MSLLDLLKRDANFITTNVADFAEPSVTFIAPTGEQAVVQSLHTKHHFEYDLQAAQEINTLKAHVAVSEQEFIDLGYPVRNTRGFVNMKGHKVKASDANGREWTYVVAEFFENDKVGVIICILGEFEPQP
jgi:hypothetical protein